MNPVAKHPEGLVLGDGNSIQPVEPGADFAHQAEPVDRLAADVELLSRLMWAQYDGPEWRVFRKALAQYGVVVIEKWIFSGRIFAECRRKGFGTLRRRRVNDRDEALGLAGETVARAFLFFRDRVLVRGVWDPTMGASVRTYFIGACILHFPNVYSRSLGSEWLVQARQEIEFETLRDANRFSRPDSRVELASDFHAIGDRRTQDIVLLTAEGHSQKEIAAALKTTRKAVEMKLSRLHARKP
jgi:hypothetical protein